MIKNLIANIPIYIARAFALVISILSYIGTIFLTIGLETHKVLGTAIGLKLLETEAMNKKVAEYLNKQATAKPITTQAAASQESKRLLNLVKTDKPE